MRRKYTITILLSMLLSVFCYSQNEYQSIRKGNKHYHNEQYTDAEIDYRKSLDKNNSLHQATYNLGNAIYQQARYDEAIEQFQQSADLLEPIEDKAAAYHNTGNSFLEKKEYQKSIDAYKEALKLYPSDMDTKYNLAYAQQMLQQQQEQEQQQNQEQNQENENNQEEENQEEDQQEQDQNEEQQDQQPSENDQEEQEQQEQEQNEEQSNEKDNQESRPQPNQLTREEAERLLEALANMENELQEELKEKNATPVTIEIEKDW